MLLTARSLLGGAVVLGMASMATVLALGGTAGLRHPDTWGYDDLLVAGAGWALVVGIAWAALVSAAAVVEVSSAGRLVLTGRLGCPAVVHRGLLAGLGAVLAGGGAAVAGPAFAVPPPTELPVARLTGTGSTTLPIPARPTGALRVVPRQHVEVRPGDSLWRLAEQRSPRRASAQAVARLVARTYRANRDVIGPDPDLIRPGQRLHLPDQRRDTPPPPLEAP